MGFYRLQCRSNNLQRIRYRNAGSLSSIINT